MFLLLFHFWPVLLLWVVVFGLSSSQLHWPFLSSIYLHLLKAQTGKKMRNVHLRWRPRVEQKGGCQISSLDDSFSESDQSIDESSVTDQDSEADWPYYSGNVGPRRDDSDGSISDEESLIEIALPSGHYVGPEKEEAKLSSQKEQKFQSPMEFLADINEVNEEDNLIEIDISMGSIKCSRFEIEA
ncbi:hypothetical protein Acr_17g0009710 [Actinidia rufa]|uniref:Uncharacterized protein n=1 Tax=Actinidia rufa TaxID=165716 RepID=A0A7J0G3Q0_9ERIC|nr:hypothetical protein Acr_17g0009710 [Actinidia rufa]